MPSAAAGEVPARTRRRITGTAEIPLPWEGGGGIDWAGLTRLIERSTAAGLVPAVNLDAGCGAWLDAAERVRVLDLARRAAGPGFVAGAHACDAPGASHDRRALARELERIAALGGIPVIMPSHGLAALDDAAWVVAHRELAEHCERFLACELDPAFGTAGRIRSAAACRGLLGIPQCSGEVFSSFERAAEWERLALRNRHRPGFSILSANPRALDQVTYGSDYLLALAGALPDSFARRDSLWAEGDAGFLELNDLLQYAGQFAFRAPVPAYRHDLALLLELRGWIGCSATHPKAPARPASDRDVLLEIAERLGVVC